MPFYNPREFNLPEVLHAVFFVALKYLGFDCITTLSEDARNPKRDVLLATVATRLSSDSDIEAYLSDRQAKGINLIWVGLVDATNRGEGSHNVGHTENDGFGNNPWNGGADFTGMDGATAYWTHVDYVLQREAAHVITVLSGTAFTGAFASCTFPYYASMATTSDATMTAYGAFVGNHYKSYPGILTSRAHSATAIPMAAHAA
ncbi:MAG: DUF4038 domain-containing protein [Terriglobia bacterium]